MSNFTDRLKEFLGERWTSPMYKGFVFSRILWNRNFLYVLIFENSEQILLKTQKLKSIYLNEIYSLDFNSFLHLFLGPIVSMLLFFYIFSGIELVIRRRANQIKADQTREDNKVLSADIEKGVLLNQERENELNAIKIKLEKELKEKNAEVDRINLEKMKISSELELSKTKKGSSIEDDWSEEYNEAESLGKEFISAMEGLKKLISFTDEGVLEETLIYKDNAFIFKTYDLYETGYYSDPEYESYYNVGKLTDKGKFFLRKYLTQRKEIAGRLSRSSKEEKIKDLPF